MTPHPALARRLRTETRAAHDAIEAAMDFEARVADAAAYRRWLERLYGFHRAWEPQVAAALDDAAFFEPRRKLHLLADDLARMGLDAAARDALPMPDGWGGFASAAEALGSMYVVEGSTLGGQVIARAVRASSGFEPAYHASYGREAGRMWRGFQDRLGSVGTDGHDAAVAAATRTFERLGRWLAA